MATVSDDVKGSTSCPACGGTVGATSAVCIFCGSILRPDRLALFPCSACGEAVMGWQQFCVTCGAGLSDAQPVVPQASRIPSISLPPPVPLARSAPPRPSERAPAVSAPPAYDQDLLSRIRDFVTSRKAIVLGVAIVLLAAAPWVRPADEVVARLIVPASGRVTEKAVGDQMELSFVVLNAEPGSAVRVVIDGRPSNPYEVAVGLQTEVPDIVWVVTGPVGTEHVLTLEVRSPDGKTTTGEPARVLVTG